MEIAPSLFRMLVSWGEFMPWRSATSLPFTHVDIVSRVPSESGVYAILTGDSCLVVGESWNLKARLLELASALVEAGHLTIAYELCPDDQRSDRKRALAAELIAEPEDSLPPPHLPGLLISTRAD
jgi:hypothetical protein